MALSSEYLHTSSVYAPYTTKSKNLVSYQNSEDELEKLYIKIYESLIDKEKEFYQRFGYNNADDFYQGIKNIMRESEKDLNILRNLSSSNLRKTLRSYSKNINNLLEGKDIILSLKLHENFNLSDDIKNLFNKIGLYSISNGQLNIAMKFNVPAIKKIINVSQKKHFHTKSTDMSTLLAYLRDKTSNLVTIYSGTNINDLTVEFPLRVSPFNYGVEEIKNNTDEQQLLEIKANILNFININLGISNGSDLFQNAVSIVLNQTIGEKLTDISFFVGGGDSWIDNVVGAMGEFQAAIFFNYIAKKCPNKNLANEITEIIGNQSEYGQKLHSDLQVLESFGIQVKNYSHAGFGGREREITVRLHPMEVAPLMSDQGLVSSILNSYFNISLPQYSEEDWQIFFEQHAAELLNLEIPTSIQIPSKVSFYLIGGHLIPGSEIIRRAFITQNDQKAINVRTSLSANMGRTMGFTDFGYAADMVKDHPRFLEWWEGYTGHWRPTEKNQLETANALVSIRAHFTYTSFWNEDIYKIF